MAKKKTLKRNIIEWAVILGAVGFLYFTGLYTEVIGKAQQLVLLTGLIQPEMNIPASEQKDADYNLILLSFNNRITPMSDFKDKVVFINFWASWCPPCRAEMPTIEKLYLKLHDNPNIVFAAVSLDEDTAKAKEFLRNQGYTFPAYFPAGSFPSIYNSGTIPSTYIISRQGKIVAEKIGMADYNTSKVINFISEMARDKITEAKTD